MSEGKLLVNRKVGTVFVDRKVRSGYVRVYQLPDGHIEILTNSPIITTADEFATLVDDLKSLCETSVDYGVMY